MTTTTTARSTPRYELRAPSAEERDAWVEALAARVALLQSGVLDHVRFAPDHDSGGATPPSPPAPESDDGKDAAETRQRECQELLEC